MDDQNPVYLDDNGNPIAAAPAAVYLDDNGNPVAAPAAPEGKSLAGFGANVLSSGAKFAGDIVDSAKGIGHMASRVAQGVFDPKVRGENRDAIIAGVKNIPNAVGEIAKSAGDRYGSLDKIGNTLYNDPIGVLGDVAGVAGLASGVGEAAGAARLAKAAGSVERLANPASLFARPVTAMAKAVAEPLQKGGVSLYTRVLKPSTAELEKLNPNRWGSTTSEKAFNVSEGLINEGVNVNSGGVHKLGTAIDELGAERAGIIKNLDDYDPVMNPNGKVTRVPTKPMTSSINDAAKFAGRQLDSAEPTAAVLSGHERLNANQALTKVKRASIGGMPPRAAQQALGQATQPVGRELLPQVRVGKLEDLAKGTRAEMRAAGNAYGGGRLPADVSRDKAMLAGANEAIGTADPKIAGISKEMARKISLEDFLERGAARSGKNDFLGTFDMAAAGLGHPGFMAAKIAQRGGPGSMVARGVYKAGKAAGKAKLSPLAQQALLIAALEGRDE